MPNWATTIIKFKTSPERLCDIHGFLAGENGAIDFNCLIPEPDNLMNRQPVTYEMENPFGKGPQSFTEPAWYKWRCDNWGTKWNADSWWRDNDTLCIRTAWAPPGPIIEQIEGRFPDVAMDMDMYLEFEGHKYSVFYENGIETFVEYNEEGEIILKETQKIEKNPFVKEKLEPPFVYDCKEEKPNEFTYIQDLTNTMDDKLLLSLYEEYYCDQCVNCCYLGTYLIDGEYKQCIKVIISQEPIKVNDSFRWWRGSGNKIKEDIKPRWNGLEGLISGSFVVCNGLIMLRDDPRIGKKLTDEEIRKANEPYVIEEVKKRQKEIYDKFHATEQEIALWEYYNGPGSYNKGIIQ